MRDGEVAMYPERHNSQVMLPWHTVDTQVTNNTNASPGVLMESGLLSALVSGWGRREPGHARGSFFDNLGLSVFPRSSITQKKNKNFFLELLIEFFEVRVGLDLAQNEHVANIVQNVRAGLKLTPRHVTLPAGLILGQFCLGSLFYGHLPI